MMEFTNSLQKTLERSSTLHSLLYFELFSFTELPSWARSWIQSIQDADYSNQSVVAGESQYGITLTSDT
jgi:hypothetical protein